MASVTGWWAEIFVEPESAALTLVGAVPVVDLTQDVYVSPTPASLTLVGSTPSLGQTLHPTDASLSLVGGVPNVTVGRELTPTPATLTLTGSTPSVGTGVSPTPASLTLTGGTPTITISGDHLITPTPATLTLTGNTPSIGTRVSPSSASLTLTGGTPSVGTGVSPTPGSLTLTGGTPALRSTVTPTSALLTLTGGSPTIDTKVAPTSAALALTGGTPALNTTVAPTSAALTLTGGVPTVTTISTVSLVGSNANAGSSVTIPTHQVGDLIVIFAFNPFTTSAPTKPSAGGTVPDFTYIDNANSGSGSGCTTAYFKATATNTTSGTWSSPSHMIAAVLRDQHASSPIGGHAQQGGSSATSTAPSVTLTHTNGSSVLLYFHGHSNLGASGWDAAPTGYTRQAASGSGFQSASALNTKNVTTSDGSAGQTGGQNTSYAAATVEIIN